VDFLEKAKHFSVYNKMATHLLMRHHHIYRPAAVCFVDQSVQQYYLLCWPICENMGESRCKPLPPDVDGYLEKLKHKRSIFGAWTRRYFRVNVSDDRLEYFKSKQQCIDDADPLGIIDLNELSAVRKFDTTSFQVIMLIFCNHFPFVNMNHRLKLDLMYFS
jgi:hypothetical protein